MKLTLALFAISLTFTGIGIVQLWFTLTNPQRVALGFIAVGSIIGTLASWSHRRHAGPEAPTVRRPTAHAGEAE